MMSQRAACTVSLGLKEASFCVNKKPIRDPDHDLASVPQNFCSQECAGEGGRQFGPLQHHY